MPKPLRVINPDCVIGLSSPGTSSSNTTSKMAVAALSTALTIISLSASDAIAQHSQSANSVAAQQLEARYADGLIKPVARPEGYDYLRLDATTKRIHPQARAIEVGIFFHNRIKVYNFVDHSTPEHAKFSEMQKHVLETTLRDVAPKSQAKRILLVEIDTTDYPVDFATFYGRNNLGPNRSKVGELIRPYGVVEVSGIKQSGPTIFDFAPSYGVKNNADLNTNAASIHSSLGLVVLAVNRSNGVSDSTVTK